MRRSLFKFWRGLLIIPLLHYSKQCTQAYNGLSLQQKCIVTLCLCTVPLLTLFLSISKWGKFHLECLKLICRGVISCFGEEYSRCPTVDDLRRLLAKGEERGFPGTIGSRCFMHQKWMNCPIEWSG